MLLNRAMQISFIGLDHSNTTASPDSNLQRNQNATKDLRYFYPCVCSVYYAIRLNTFPLDYNS